MGYARQKNGKWVYRWTENGKQRTEYVGNDNAKNKHAQKRDKAKAILYPGKPVTPDMPADKYRAIVVDPPWPVEKILRDERPNQVGFDYPVMAVNEIKALRLPACPGGCHVYLWATHKHLPDAFEVFEAWGIKYQCLLTWVKNVGFTPFSWMYSTEHVLYGHIGSLPLLQMGKRLDFKATVHEHSRKPEVFYELVVSVSPGPRLDMFSREPHEGFEQWGNEVNKWDTTKI